MASSAIPPSELPAARPACRAAVPVHPEDGAPRRDCRCRCAGRDRCAPPATVVARRCCRRSKYRAEALNNQLRTVVGRGAARTDRRQQGPCPRHQRDQQGGRTSGRPIFHVAAARTLSYGSWPMVLHMSFARVRELVRAHRDVVTPVTLRVGDPSRADPVHQGARLAVPRRRDPAHVSPLLQLRRLARPDARLCGADRLRPVQAPQKGRVPAGRSDRTGRCRGCLRPVSPRSSGRGSVSCQLAG